MPDVLVTDHAIADRWTRYVGDGTPDDVREAWHGGLPLADHGFYCDEARYDPVHDVVLLRRGSSIVTIIDNDDQIRQEARMAIGVALDRFGTERLDR